VQSLGASLLALSPQLPVESQTTVEKNGVTFHLLSDQGNAVAKKFRLVFSLPEELREVYVKLGIDLTVVNGDDSWELPIPATYVIGQDGIVKAMSADGDYVPRMEPADILAALKNLNA
jgi:peroxiredoxin